MSNPILSWRRVRALCVKETRQIVRDPIQHLCILGYKLIHIPLCGCQIISPQGEKDCSRTKSLRPGDQFVSLVQVYPDLLDHTGSIEDIIF